MTLTAVPTVHRKSSTRTGVWRASLLMNRRMLIAFVLLPAAISTFLWLSVPDTHGMTVQRDSGSPAWNDLAILLNQNWSFGGPLVNGFPFAAAVFLGAANTSRIYDTGTFRFLWTQGAGRTRLATAIMLQATLLAGLGAATVVLSFRLTYYPLFRSTQIIGESTLNSGFQFQYFILHVPVYIGFTMMLTALGLVLGSLLRKTVPSIAAAVGITAIAFVMFQFTFGATLRMNPHEFRTVDDPVMQFPATRAEMQRRGLMQLVGNTSGEVIVSNDLPTYQVGQGFMNVDGSLADPNAYLRRLTDTDGDGVSWKTGQAYRDAVASIGKPWVIRYRHIDDLPYYDYGWGAALGGLTLLLMITTLRVVRRR